MSRRPFEKTLGDVVGRAPADGRDAGELEKVLDQRAARVGSRSVERGEQAGMLGFARPFARDVLDRAAAHERALEAPPERDRRINGVDRRVHDRPVAETHDEVFQAERPAGLDGKREDLRVGLGRVRRAEDLDARLRGLAAIRAVAENRSLVEVARLAVAAARDVGEGGRNGEVGAQAQFPAARVLGEEDALPERLAHDVEKRLRRLQDAGLGAQESVRGEAGGEGFWKERGGGHDGGSENS